MSGKKESEEQTNFLLYTGDDGKVNVDVFLQDETVWLTQKTIGSLFGKSKATISEHLSRIFETGELTEDSVVRKFRTTAADGKTYNTKFYNLDAIISVGYRVNSHQATQFRIWATRTLKEYLIKGFALDDERLKQGNSLFGKSENQESKRSQSGGWAFQPDTKGASDIKPIIGTYNHQDSNTKHIGSSGSRVRCSSEQLALPAFFLPLSPEGAFYISLGQRPRSQIGQNSGLKARPII